ncbi:MAG TPA: class I SAM-dependent methyltransferase [Methylomirabilota bacterium]|nr:class I SAM-dependent methyltransferase [Methylomirabilota bacterium]
MRSVKLSLALVLIVAVAVTNALGQAPTQQKVREPDVQYVPTPQPVVNEMLKLTKVTKNDVVYDLGSGDGRILITAAKVYGARGVGYDIDPDRVREATENAVKAGVDKRVRFVQGDLFEADLKEATVVTLYLLQSLNLKLRPKLFAELRPGTRIVSHDFDMGDWKPDQTAKLQVNGREHTVYYWLLRPGAMPR